MINKCSQCSSSFEITDEDLKFYKKIGVSAPTLCPDDRSRRRMQFRNFRTLYRTTSSLSGKSMISMYPPQTPLTVYSIDEWWNDNWDALKFGRDMDFNRPFFEQFDALFKQVPKLPLKQIQCEKCEYSNFSFSSKNCYLVFGCVENENCLYGHIVWRSEDCVDGLYNYECRFCYDCIDCVGCYQAYFSTECINCTDIWFSHDCLGCQNCFGCTGLRRKEWCWENEYLGKEKYVAKLKETLPLTYNRVNKEKEKLAHKKDKSVIFPAFFGYANEDVSGNHIYFSKNTYCSFDAKRCEDCKFLFTAQTFTDCYDCNFTPGGCELAFESMAVGNSQRLVCCREIQDSSDLFYCFECMACQNCFGCDGLKHKQYCILNKQYSKEEYEKFVARIIKHMVSTGEWGEFFHHSISPFAYNETVANEYYPLTREEALKKGFRWSDYESPKAKAEKSISAPEVPANINDVSDDILNTAIECEVSGRPFKIVPQELMFYRKNQLPLPKRHPDQRHFDRMALRTPRKLWPRLCAKCNKSIQTTFAPEKPEKVYCEACYLKEVY